MSERIKNKFSIFDQEISIGEHDCLWALIQCESGVDVEECKKCGKQKKS